MTIRTAAALILALAIGVLLGYEGGRFGEGPAIEPQSSVTKSSTQAAAAAETPAAAQPEVSNSKSPWTISINKNKMTDIETVEMSALSTGQEDGLLSVSCGIGDSVSIYSKALGSMPDKINLTYRVDQKKAVSLEEWQGFDDIASLSYKPEPFLDYLKGGKTLKVEIFAYRQENDFTFDLADFDEQLAKLHTQCSKLTQPK